MNDILMHTRKFALYSIGNRYVLCTHNNVNELRETKKMARIFVLFKLWNASTTYPFNINVRNIKKNSEDFINKKYFDKNK